MTCTQKYKPTPDGCDSVVVICRLYYHINHRGEHHSAGERDYWLTIYEERKKKTNKKGPEMN